MRQLSSLPVDGETPNSTEGPEPSLSEALRAHRTDREDQESSPPPGQQPTSDGGQAPPSTPPWGSDFSAERAWSTIQRQRETERQKDQRIRELERERMTEADRTKAERDQYKQELEQSRFENLRRDIAAARGLPPRALTFLTGSTQEELERNADELKQMIGANDSPPPAPDFGAGARPNGSSSASEENFTAMLRRAAGRP
jgi:hypothetical protein